MSQTRMYMPSTSASRAVLRLPRMHLAGLAPLLAAVELGDPGGDEVGGQLGASGGRGLPVGEVEGGEDVVLDSLTGLPLGRE